MRLIVIFLLLSSFCYGQSFNLDQVGKAKLVRYNGGISANAVYYSGSSNRQPFTYYLNGNLNFNIAGLYNIPLSFTYSNQDFDFANPFKFNRLSLHPSYKWITAHIGDVSMTFSPYTLSGHQFTGGGVELTPPDKPFKVSAMYGRFLKATEYNPNEEGGIVAYKRMGYGAKASYEFEKISLGLIYFHAKDDENSLRIPYPSELELAPKENTVISAETNINLFDRGQLRVEYAISGVTEDSRLTDERGEKGMLSFLLDENISTEYYSALNASFDYPAGNGSVGVGYERIDPDYKTLGAYYFNNDLENITLNVSQTVFNDKLSVAVNTGFQRDNLDKQKSSEMQRIVGSVNLGYTHSDKLSLNGSYSNFQSYTNIRDQFDYINQVDQFQNLDTLNYRQVSQNANLGANYNLLASEEKNKTISLNMVYQNAVNQQGGTVVEGGENSFYNGAAGYTVGYIPLAMNVTLAGNASYNTVGQDKSLTWGPTLSVGKLFFDKKLRTNFSSSYNASYSNGDRQGSVYNFRLGGSYVYMEKHNFSLNFLSLFRNSVANSVNDFTATLTYSYTFDNFKIKLNRTKRDPLYSEPTVRFRYRDVTYDGTLTEVTEQISNVKNSDQFANIPISQSGNLNVLFATIQEQEEASPYKEHAINFLEELYGYGDFLQIYDQLLFNVINQLKRDMRRIDYQLEKRFVGLKVELDEHPLKGKDLANLSASEKEMLEDYQLQEKELVARQQKMVGHRWMEVALYSYNSMNDVVYPDELLNEFKQKTSNKSYEIFAESNDLEKIKVYLELQMIDFYYKKSLEAVNPDAFKLRYIDKTEN
ncbi:hypothetical protein JM658_15185 [Joostella atrarenae]|uniref:Outer membrane protein beta-barrel domain-containing protein n=1 Tax=Joostella atrarenae TaxID=679257 RepID=A0ABS9J759_9FLAO|nr:hypothetical protein [Joostella atrarenae]MCF8716173.1 hypothetical protein [Joostella atrarenae]